MHPIYRAIGALVCIIVFLPTVAHAAMFSGGEEYSLSQRDIVTENLYVGAGRATIAGQVHGDLVLAAGSATVTGDILDDALIVGGSVTILGLIGDDMRIAGGQISVGGSVGGEMVAAGGEIHILPDAEIGGDLYVAGGRVILDGTVRGDVFVRGGRLTLNGVVLGDMRVSLEEELSVGRDAVIGGELQYRAARQAEFPPTSSVGSGIVFSGPTRMVDGAAAGGGILGLFLLRDLFGIIAGIIFTLRLLAWLGFALLIVWAWRRWVLEVVQEFVGSFFKSLGQGLIVFIAAPLVIALLLLSFIGTFVGIAGIAFYALFLMFARVFAAIVLGAWLGKLIQKRTAWRITIPWTIAGVVVMQVLYVIPFLGWLVASILSLAMLGVLTRMAMNKAHR